MKKLRISIAIITVFASCNTTQHLHESGTYTIKEKNGDVTEFYEVKGRFSLVSDTLKKNDKIFINVVRAKPLRQRIKKENDIAKLF
ncbi:MAG: hypothetical protein ABIN94_12150 [Ferruginibacter sp.]